MSEQYDDFKCPPRPLYMQIRKDLSVSDLPSAPRQLIALEIIAGLPSPFTRAQCAKALKEKMGVTHDQALYLYKALWRHYWFKPAKKD